MSLDYVSTQDIDLFQQKLDENVKCIKGIMKVHQCLVNKEDRNSLSTKMLSCFCAPEEFYSCNCFSIKKHSLLDSEKDGIPEILLGNSEAEHAESDGSVSAHVEGGVQGEAENRGMNIQAGEYCTFLYEGSLYAGLIEAVDENEVQISSLKNVGSNRFVWPNPKDCIWYNISDVQSIISAPKEVNKRLLALDKELWHKISQVNMTD